LQIFQISSLNHHISILKLTVHKAYIEYLTTGQLPIFPPSDTDDERAWYSPKLQRTRWYDLFDVDDRVDAFRAVWGVVGWLTRDDGKNSETASTS
jgi:hypothetical protein